MLLHGLSTSTNLVLQQKANNSRQYTDRRKKIENKKKKQRSLITSKLFPGPRIAYSLCCGLTKKKKVNSHLRSHCHFVNQKHTQVRGTEVSLNDGSAIVLNYCEGSSFLPFFLPPKFKCHSLCEVQSSKEDPPRQAGKKVKF